MGDLTLRFMETPGHTPESVCVVASVAGEPGPRLVFTGDTLFIGDVGRPDLVGGRRYTAEQMAELMYRSLRDRVLALPDATEVWPAHGAGSACGRALSDERVSTIGRERATNPAVRFVEAGDEAGFVRYAVEGLAVAPAYFAHDAARNREGAASLSEVMGSARALEPAELEELSEGGLLVLDSRGAEAFGASHVPGALNIPLDGKFAPWVGSLLPPAAGVLVVAESGREDEAITRLARVGYEGVAGWLRGGMDAWRTAGGEVETVLQVEPEAVRARLAGPSALALLDVREPSEWAAGHADGALHVPLGRLAESLSELPAGPLAVLCGSGYRSSIACSLLQRAGRRDVANVAGGWDAWAASR